MAVGHPTVTAVNGRFLSLAASTPPLVLRAREGGYNRAIVTGRGVALASFHEGEKSVRCLSSGVSCLLIVSTLALPLAAQSRGGDRDRVDRDLVEGDRGIAAKHPGDAGIGNHAAVIFVENFNDNLATIKGRWEQVNGDNLSLSPETPQASQGDTALLVTHTGGKDTGAHLYRRLDPGYAKLHYRFYVRFAEDCAPIHHFFHVGGYNPATPWAQGGAGERPRGDKRLTTGVEPFGELWRWDYYSYWMEMRGSPPRGQCWGNSFIHDPSLRVTKGEWQCLELMMKLNDVGKSNGEMALWIDGKLVSHLRQGAPRGKWVFDKFLPGEGGQGARWDDQRGARVALEFPAEGQPFEGFRWRSDEDLQLNFLWLLCFITQAPEGHVSRIWFDDVVVATEYIGPLVAP